MSMVVIYGANRVKADRIEEVAKVATEFAAKVHEEVGCLAYILSWDVADPTRFHLIEHWATPEDYEVHRTQPHVAEWAAFITEAQSEGLVVTKMRAELL